MSFLCELDRYLTLRRALGADLSTDARIIRRFATFADGDGAQHVSTNLVMRWLESLPSASPGTRATCFRVARQFAEWLHGIDPRHEAPPRGLVPGHLQRVHPYIYSEAEITAIVEHADYIGSWLEVLREDNRAVVRAASLASKATNWLLGHLPPEVALPLDVDADQNRRAV